MRGLGAQIRTTRISLDYQIFAKVHLVERNFAKMIYLPTSAFTSPNSFSFPTPVTCLVLSTFAFIVQNEPLFNLLSVLSTPSHSLDLYFSIISVLSSQPSLTSKPPTVLTASYPFSSQYRLVYTITLCHVFTDSRLTSSVNQVLPGSRVSKGTEPME